MKVGNNEIVNLLSHPVDIKVGDNILHWEAADKSRKPIVKYKTVEVENKYIDLVGGDKIVQSVNNLPKRKKGVLYIVNSFVLDAIIEKDASNAAYFIAPGRQNRGEGGKVSYAEGFYYKQFKK